MRRVLTASLVLLLVTAGPVAARTLDQPPAYIKKEGKFVAYPAQATSIAWTLLGGALVSPLGLVTLPIGFAVGDPIGYGLLPSAIAGNGMGELGYHVGGAIPYALKKTFHDGPLAIAHAVRGDPSSGLVVHVEPAPEFSPIDRQYLESTHPDERLPIVLPREYSIALPPPRQPTSLMLKRQLSPFKLPPPAPAAAAAASAAPGRTALSQPAPLAPAATPKPAAPVAAPRAQQAAAPAVAAPSVQAKPAPRPPAEKAPAVEPAAEEAEALERPSLKKKRKFSERFGF